MSLHYLELDEDTDKFVELDLKDLPDRRSRVVIMNIEGALYFAAVEDLEERVNHLIDLGVEVIILRMRRTNMIASTATKVRMKPASSREAGETSRIRIAAKARILRESVRL